MPPPSDEIKARLITEAERTVALLQALAKDPEYRVDLKSIRPRATGFRYIVEFVVTTWRNYWPTLLPPEKMTELSCSMEQFNGKSKEEKLEQLNGWHAEQRKKNPNYDLAAWPNYNPEKFSDCMGRTAMAMVIIQDPEKQDMMGGRHNYSQEVIDLCKRST